MKNNNLNLIFTLLGGILLLFIVAPILGLFLFTSKGSIINTINDEETIKSMGLTLWASMSATIIASFLAIPLAYLLARKSFWGRSFILSLINLPIVIPHTAAGIALLGVVSSNTTIGKFLKYLGLDFINNPKGIIIAMMFVSVPFLVNAAYEAFSNVPVKLEKAALTLGASVSKMFFTISLPLASKGIISGMIMMFARGMSEFGAVVIIAYYPTITPVLIYEKFTSLGLSYALPITTVFMIITLIVFIVLNIVQR